MSDNAHFPRLFSSLEVGARTLRNRVVLSATLTNFGAGHRVTERWTNFLAERAKGGCGTIVTEVIAVDPAALSHGAIVTGYDKENEDGFKRTAEAVEGAGACLIAQLWHPGRQQLWSPVWSPKGISDQPDAYSWTVPHVMTTDELRQVIEEYVSVAQRLKRCGFGGAELHGAHGYLISQILSPWSNQRSDRVRRLAGKSRALRRRGLRRDPVDLRQGLRDRSQDAGRRGRRRRHRSGRGRAHHGGAGAPRHARLFRLQPGQLHQQPGKPRAGHALPARTVPRHSQEDPPCRRRQARDGHRPHRHAGGGRGRARRGCRRSRRHDAGADRGCRLAEQGARGPRERHPPVELRQFRLGRDPSRQAAGRDSQSAAWRRKANPTGDQPAPSGRSGLSWWALARLACRRLVWPRSADTT